MRLMRIILLALVLSFTVVVSSRLGFTQSTALPKDDGTKAAPKDDGARPADTITPGTVITMDNWRNYQPFMPDGMVALFEGKYFWKMPPDVRIEVGPTVIHPLAKNYVDATDKYSSQVKLIDLPGGGLTLDGYHGGV